MVNYQPTPDFYTDYLQHYNHNHDPRTGQFTSSGAGISSSTPGQGKNGKQTEHGSITATMILAAVGTVVARVAISMLINKAANKSVEVTQQLAKRSTYKKLSELRETEKIDKKTGLRLKANKDATPEEDLIFTNAQRGGKGGSKTFNNCTYCTTAYDLRRRGFDVIAGTTKHGTTVSDIATWYKGGKFTRATVSPGLINNKKRRQEIKDELLKQPVGARGNLCVTWSRGYGSGHSMAYEITKNGLLIRDGQTGKTYTDTKSSLGNTRTIDAILSRSVLTQVDYMRTDNLTPNYKLLKERGIII